MPHYCRGNMNKQLTILLFALLSITLVATFVSAQSAVDLGTAGDFVILAKSGISTTGTTAITEILELAQLIVLQLLDLD